MVYSLYEYYTTNITQVNIFKVNVKLGQKLSWGNDITLLKRTYHKDHTSEMNALLLTLFIHEDFFLCKLAGAWRFENKVFANNL